MEQICLDFVTRTKPDVGLNCMVPIYFFIYGIIDLGHITGLAPVEFDVGNHAFFQVVNMPCRLNVVFFILNTT